MRKPERLSRPEGIPLRRMSQHLSSQPKTQEEERP